MTPLAEGENAPTSFQLLDYIFDALPPAGRDTPIILERQSKYLVAAPKTERHHGVEKRHQDIDVFEVLGLEVRSSSSPYCVVANLHGVPVVPTRRILSARIPVVSTFRWVDERLRCRRNNGGHPGGRREIVSAVREQVLRVMSLLARKPMLAVVTHIFLPFPDPKVRR